MLTNYSNTMTYTLTEQTLGEWTRGDGTKVKLVSKQGFESKPDKDRDCESLKIRFYSNKSGEFKLEGLINFYKEKLTDTLRLEEVVISDTSNEDLERFYELVGEEFVDYFYQEVKSLRLNFPKPEYTWKRTEHAQVVNNIYKEYDMFGPYVALGSTVNFVDLDIDKKEEMKNKRQRMIDEMKTLFT